MSPRCRRCGRHLSDPLSLRVGKGPECRGKEPTPREELCDAIDAVLAAPETDVAASSARRARDRLEAGKQVSKRLRSTVTFWAQKAVA